MEGKIYKITSALTDKVYIGSTIRCLNIRLNTHYSDLKYCSSRELLQYSDAKIELIHDFPCETKEELYMEEQRVMELFPTRVNAHRAYVSDELNLELARNRMKENRLNPEFIAREQKYKEDHKEESKEYFANYRATHKEEIAEWHKQNYAENKDAILADGRERANKKWTCPLCEIEMNSSSQYRHMKRKHK